jgi:N utilization substance protein B
MGRRRKARENALQLLFQLDFNEAEVETALSLFWKGKRETQEVKEYSAWLVRGIYSHLEKIDSVIRSHSQNWRLARMAAVDRNILRIAVFELLYEENVAAAVIINEAIEIAKKYSNEQAASFVNGILDGVRKELGKKGSGEKESEDVKEAQKAR